MGSHEDGSYEASGLIMVNIGVSCCEDVIDGYDVEFTTDPVLLQERMTAAILEMKNNLTPLGWLIKKERDGVKVACPCCTGRIFVCPKCKHRGTVTTFEFGFTEDDKSTGMCPACGHEEESISSFLE